MFLNGVFMKTKIVSIITVSSIVMIAIIVSLITILVGTKNVSSSYVKLELNPKIEFVCDIHKNVVSFCALNDEAKITTSNLNLKGEHIEDAVKLFLTECAKLGYVNLNQEDFNVIKLTVVSGITQSLDVSVYKSVNKWLAKNEVMGVIIENQNDMEMLKEAKKLNISVNKLSLIKSATNLNLSLKKEHLKNVCEKDLIDIINDLHKNVKKDNLLAEKKMELLNQNGQTFLDHISQIDSNKQGKFVQKLRDLNRTEQTKVELNYSKYDK